MLPRILTGSEIIEIVRWGKIVRDKKDGGGGVCVRRGTHGKERNQYVQTE